MSQREPSSAGTANAPPPSLRRSSNPSTTRSSPQAGASSAVPVEAAQSHAQRTRKGSSRAQGSTAGAAGPSSSPSAGTAKPSSIRRRQSAVPTGSSSTSSPVTTATAAGASAAPTSHPCPQCRDAQSSFYCARCLSDQLRAYRSRVNRLRAICSDAQDRINAILGPVPASLDPAHAQEADTAPTARRRSSGLGSAHGGGADHGLAATVTLQRPQLASHSSRGPSQAPSINDDHDYAYASVLPDPFGEPGSEYSYSISGHSSSTIPSPSTQTSLPPILPHRYGQLSKASHIARTARAERAQLLLRLQAARVSLSETRQRVAELDEQKSSRRQTLDRRRSNLSQARQLASTEAQSGEELTTKSSSARATASDRQDQEKIVRRPLRFASEELGGRIRSTQVQIKMLQKENKGLMAELSRTRAILAREAFSLFLVAPASSSQASKPSNRLSQAWTGFGSSPLNFLPDNMPAAFVSPLRRPGVDGRLTTAGLRPATATTTTPRSSGGATPASSSSISPSWTIVNLPLASPLDVRKYPREDINGALSYTALLLQLLSAYLGILMPFVIESQGGRNIIMPNELWSGTGAKKHIIQLSEAAYDALKTLSLPGADRGSDPTGASSAFGLGASALSVLESFVQLPSTARLTAMLGPVGLDGSPTQAGSAAAGASALLSGGEGTIKGSGTGAGAGAGDTAAVDEYVSVLSMLSYNAAYLAHVQGVRVDLVAAATSPLALLARAMSSTNKTLGVRAHGTYASEVHIRNLGRNDIEWGQVRLVLDPYRGGGGAGGGSGGSAGREGTMARASKGTAAPAMLSTAGRGPSSDRRAMARPSGSGKHGSKAEERGGSGGGGGDDDWDVV